MPLPLLDSVNFDVLQQHNFCTDVFTLFKRSFFVLKKKKKKNDLSFYPFSLHFSSIFNLLRIYWNKLLEMYKHFHLMVDFFFYTHVSSTFLYKNKIKCFKALIPVELIIFNYFIFFYLMYFSYLLLMKLRGIFKE